MASEDSETRNRRGVAFHEAGHAIVAWSLGLNVEKIEIRNDGGGKTHINQSISRFTSCSVFEGWLLIEGTDFLGVVL